MSEIDKTLGRFDNLKKQQDDVYKGLVANNCSHELAVWLADLHVRVRECEMALLNGGLATEKP